MWSSFITACRIHKNIKLGEFVAECVIELDIQKATPYVPLSNIYAATKQWGGIEKVRKMMKDVGNVVSADEINRLCTYKRLELNDVE